MGLKNFAPLRAVSYIVPNLFQLLPVPSDHTLALCFSSLARIFLGLVFTLVPSATHFFTPEPESAQVPAVPAQLPPLNDNDCPAGTTQADTSSSWTSSRALTRPDQNFLPTICFFSAVGIFLRRLRLSTQHTKHSLVFTTPFPVTLSALSRTPLPARTPPVYVVVLLNRCLYKLTEVYDFRSIPALTRLLRPTLNTVV
ncbi:hypothetical protein CpipJ_CPIJ012837 [Culex quinquefasciatus]|uniref:Uncharacterized protein n=1 Tax=Culex quinquefasciatus TaxID=7176 RepID=B0X1M3_CULQU|nr:hypothetical protein CpipJ_CPIJ012837 [Culex quinquefasciatus]|eukprot:XP_001863545.1 hypothetical protein CpipJ_CPIJ012837 [Culex quinquefasciatus]